MEELGTAKKLAVRTKSKANKIEVICLGEELEGFRLSKGDGCETVDAEVGDTPVPEEKEGLFADIDDILSTGSNQEGGIRGTCVVRKRVEVVTRSGRRAGPVAHDKSWPRTGRSAPAKSVNKVRCYICPVTRRVISCFWVTVKPPYKNKMGTRNCILIR